MLRYLLLKWAVPKSVPYHTIGATAVYKHNCSDLFSDAFAALSLIVIQAL